MSITRPPLASALGRGGARAPAGEQGGGGGRHGGGGGEKQAGAMQGGDWAAGAGPGGDKADPEGAGTGGGSGHGFLHQRGSVSWVELCYMAATASCRCFQPAFRVRRRAGKGPWAAQRTGAEAERGEAEPPASPARPSPAPRKRPPRPAPSRRGAGPGVPGHPARSGRRTRAPRCPGPGRRMSGRAPPRQCQPRPGPGPRGRPGSCPAGGTRPSDTTGSASRRMPPAPPRGPSRHPAGPGSPAAGRGGRSSPPGSPAGPPPPPGCSRALRSAPLPVSHRLRRPAPSQPGTATCCCRYRQPRSAGPGPSAAPLPPPVRPERQQAPYAARCATRRRIARGATAGLSPLVTKRQCPGLASQAPDGSVVAAPAWSSRAVLGVTKPSS